jgi:hypothetical protein
VAGLVFQRLAAVESQQLHTILTQPLSSSGILNAFYGELYEPAAIAVLQQGGTFKRLDCSAKVEDPAWRLPKSSEVTAITGVADLKLKFDKNKQQLLIPRSKRFTAIDVVLPGGLMANVTINTNHDVKLRGKGALADEGLLPCAAALGVPDDKPIDMYWIVPDECYQQLKRANNVLARGAALFPLVLPEEQDMRAQVMKLTAAVNRATTDAAKKAATGELEEYKDSKKASEAEWAKIKARVRHFIVCLQFNALSPQTLAAFVPAGTKP